MNLRTLFFIALYTVAVQSSASDLLCPNVSTPGEAKGLSDWILDADVTDVYRIINPVPTVNVAIKNGVILHAAIPFASGNPPTLDIDSCYAHTNLFAWGSPFVEKIIGKKVRFYGITYSESPRHRFFYIQILTAADSGKVPK